MNTKIPVGWLVSILLVVTFTHAAEPPSITVRVAAAQAARRTFDYRLDASGALAAVEKNLGELERIIVRAGDEKCDALVLPEDTLGLLNWLGANEPLAREVLPKAVKQMIERLGAAAAKRHMYLVVCSDCIEADGAIYNTAFLLGRDGKEIGRYHKTCPTWSEAGVRKRGKSFPVFPTPDLGTAGLLICYDLVVPETARCLALAGADIIFFPTMGGAAIGDDDIGVQALRVRAAENFIWLVVAHRGSGAMIISPQGKIVAKADGPDGLAIADIDVHGNREGGDALNWQRDMRARLFRERNPEAFSILTEKNPPVLAKVPIEITSKEAGGIMARALTVGEDEFKQANVLAGQGKTNEAIAAFERLRKAYPATWIDRRSQERLAKIQPDARAADPSPNPAAVADPGAPLTMHVISGSKEYQSEASLRPFIAELEKQYRITITASWGTDGGETLENLDALKHAELLLIFARRMKLPDDQMKLIRAHWEAGQPIVGIRTASHAFQEADNDVFDRRVLGGSHQSHWADELVKVTNRSNQAGHPVLRGVSPFVSRKLYKRADLLKDVIVLQTGDNGKDTQPVTLTRVHNGGRIVYTSLGVPEDFKDENFRRLLINALFWTTHREPERMRK